MYEVIRPKDTVIVDIFREKGTNYYRYINLTKKHICPCKFKSEEDALKDMDKLIEEGKIIKYTKIK